MRLQQTQDNKRCADINKLGKYSTPVLNNTGEQQSCCLGYFTGFNSVRGQRYLNEKPFHPIRSGFSAILGFGSIFDIHWQNFHNSFTPFVPFIVLKTIVPISWFQHKNRCKKQITLGWDIFQNVFNMANQTKLPANTVFSQISRPRLGRFSNHVLRTVILSTIKRYKRSKNYYKRNYKRNPDFWPSEIRWP